IAAMPLGIDLLAEVLEDESRPTLRALAVADHRTELRAILRATFLVVREIGAQVDRRQAILQTLPASAAILAHQPVSLEEHEYDPRFASRDAGLLRELIEQRRLAQWHLLQYDRDLRRLFDVRIFPAEEIGLHAAVLDAIEQRARRRQTIAS